MFNDPRRSGRCAALALALVAGGAAAPAAERAASAPAASAASMPHGHPMTADAPKKKPPPKPAKLIDLNTASKQQLKTLPGIGDAEADRIIAARPYSAKTDLVTKNAVPTGVYLSVRSMVIVKNPKLPKQPR